VPCRSSSSGAAFAWLDTGTPESLLQAAQYVELLEQRQGLRVGVPEEIAFRMGFLDAAGLGRAAAELKGRIMATTWPTSWRRRARPVGNPEASEAIRRRGRHLGGAGVHVREHREREHQWRYGKQESPVCSYSPPQLHRDARGYLFESYRFDRLKEAGLPVFVQENQSLSAKGHRSRSALSAACVLRRSWFAPCAGHSSTLRWTSGEVHPHSGSGSPRHCPPENKHQLFIPAGFAHGFCVLEDDTEVLYKCSDYYSGAADQKGVLWSDPDLGIPWPSSAAPLVSDKDRTLLPLRAERSDLPEFGASVFSA
jgi:dTDP-4-dehydrorhamnose 3,5-epimerase